MLGCEVSLKLSWQARYIHHRLEGFEPFFKTFHLSYRYVQMIPSYFMRRKTSIGRRKNNTVRGRNNEFGYVFKKLAWKCFFPKKYASSITMDPICLSPPCLRSGNMTRNTFFCTRFAMKFELRSTFSKRPRSSESSILFFCSPCLLHSLQRSGSTPGSSRSLGVKWARLWVKKGYFQTEGSNPEHPKRTLYPLRQPHLDVKALYNNSVS